MKTPKNGFPEYPLQNEPLKGELFVRIPGSKAEASNKGRIRMDGKILPVGDNGNGVKKGYLRVTRDIGIKERLVHRLVHMAWFGAIPKDYNGRTCIVDHADGNPHNNRIENLGCMDNRRNLQIASVRGSFSGRRKRTPIKAIRLKDGAELYFNSQREASKKLNISDSSINKTLKGERMKTNGYRFEYADISDIDPVQMNIYDFIER